MKPKNFPARKLRRKLWAEERREPTHQEYIDARSIRTKINRVGTGKLR